MDFVSCQWCQSQSPAGTTSCPACGAALDQRDLVSDSGWMEAPKLRDMTEFRFSNSVCQVEGEVVPVAEIALAQGDAVFFEHHVMLWKDPQVPIASRAAAGGLKRVLAGMPVFLTYASGPGRIAFSRDATGELVVLPLHPNMEIDVREHAFLLGTHSISYSFERIKGLANIVYGGSGMYLDRFVTQGEQGLLILHGCGNVFQRTLAAGEKILIEPGGFLYKDSSVGLDSVKIDIKGPDLRMAEVTGPGRVGIQSMYHHYATEQ
ncbi:MAG: AIM24 family protein [Frankiaceae bacterium]|nr:AIM24 family protein [Frankiaceae bacterium]MBV9869713.1 AIM24 family protein [Frankiaceae bacterium]